MLPLVIALIMFTLAQMATLGIAVLFFGAKVDSTNQNVELLRKTIDERRASDRELTATQLNAIENSVARVERRVVDLLGIAGAKRESDHPFIVTPE